MKRIITLSLAILSICTAYAATCTLTNPTASIYKLFPNATSFKIVTGDIAYVGSSRSHIEKRMNMKMSLSEIGNHTIYVAMKSGKPIGYMHASVEHVSSGKMVIIWSFNVDGSIKGFLIPDSDEEGLDKINSKQFKKQFVGKRLGFQFVLDKTHQINSDYLKPVRGYESLCSVIAFSAWKTLLINSVIFKTPTKSAQLAP